MQHTLLRRHENEMQHPFVGRGLYALIRASLKKRQAVCKLDHFPHSRLCQCSLSVEASLSVFDQRPLHGSDSNTRLVVIASLVIVAPQTLRRAETLATALTATRSLRRTAGATEIVWFILLCIASLALWGAKTLATARVTAVTWLQFWLAIWNSHRTSVVVVAPFRIVAVTTFWGAERLTCT